MSKHITHQSFPKEWDQQLQSIEDARISFMRCDFIAQNFLPQQQTIFKTRIGSPSQFANVYKVNANVNTKSCICAAKAVLFVNDNKRILQKEYKIANTLFSFFPYSFLRVFKYSESDHFEWNEKEVLMKARKTYYETSVLWQNTLKALKKSSRHEWVMKKRHGPPLESYKNINVPGGMIFSQLGVGDLKQCIESNQYSPKQIQQFKLNVLDAIEKMHSLGIVHNDLHLGNVLIVWLGKGLKAVIHDFDKSEYSSDEDKRQKDKNTFLSHFEDSLSQQLRF